MNTQLTVTDLSKSYQEICAADQVCFSIHQGEVFGLLGHNGAGKSTIIDCILNVKKPDTGTVTLLGMNPASDRKRLFERVGVQFQHTGYHPKIQVGEICETTAALYKSLADWKALLASFGLSQTKNQLVSALSGGQRQKLSVLLALIPDPEFVFLDELTTGLDSRARRDVWKYLSELKEKGMTILLTSHYMDEVEALCDRICILKKGKIIATGTVKELINKSPFKTLEDAYLWFSGEEEEFAGI